jgi:hypothetical protein
MMAVQAQKIPKGITVETIVVETTPKLFRKIVLGLRNRYNI